VAAFGSQWRRTLLPDRRLDRAGFYSRTRDNFPTSGSASATTYRLAVAKGRSACIPDTHAGGA
jgi:hypothetical protein